jgi:hypothetical protein
MTDTPGIVYIKPGEITSEITNQLQQQMQEARDVLTAWISHRVICSNDWSLKPTGYDLCDTEIRIMEQLNTAPNLRESVLLLAIHMLTLEFKAKEANDAV